MCNDYVMLRERSDYGCERCVRVRVQVVGVGEWRRLTCSRHLPMLGEFCPDRCVTAGCVPVLAVVEG